MLSLMWGWLEVEGYGVRFLGGCKESRVCVR